MRWLVATMGLGGMMLATAPARATQFVVNGGFEGSATSRQMSSDGGTQYVTGWTNCATGSSCAYSSSKSLAGYNFVVNPTSTAGIATNDYGTMRLWGQSGTGVSNGLSASPDGGNYIAADGPFEPSYIYQVLTGLTVGQSYDLTFDYAGAQQYGYDGATTEGWKVIWANASNLNDAQSYTAATLTDASHGFTGWNQASTTFTATSTSEVLGFLAAGTPSGEPPISLLDGVSVVEHSVAAVPEPASWAMMIVGFGAIGTALRRSRRPSRNAIV